MLLSPITAFGFVSRTNQIAAQGFISHTNDITAFGCLAPITPFSHSHQSQRFLVPIISQLSCKWCQGIRGLYTKNDINHKFGLILISVMVCGLCDSLVDQGRDMKGSHLTFLHHFKVNSHSKCPYFLLLYHCIVGNPCRCCESDQAFLFPSCILSSPLPYDGLQ